jgi:tetratricopeptide (TPR) repeat protein
MTDVQPRPPGNSLLDLVRRPLVAVVLLLVFAAVLRLAFAGADLPMFLSMAQDDAYNAAWYVSDAQYIVQGREPQFQEGWLKILWTGYYTAFFGIFGAGVWQGGAGAAVVGIACAWLVFATVRRAAGMGAALVALLLASTSFILVMYSHTALPYIGVCAATMLCLYLWCVLRHRPWLMFVPYTLAVIFAFHLKSVAGLVLPAMAAADAIMLLRGGEGLLRRARPYIVSGAAAGLALLVEYVALRSTAKAYVGSRYGAYVGEVSLMEAVRGFLSMGFESRYFVHMPVAAFLAFLYPVMLVRRRAGRPEGEVRLGIACIALVALSLVAFGFLKYRSLHYFIIMSSPMLILAALCIRELAATERIGARIRNTPAAILAFLLVTYIAYQVISAITVALGGGGDASGFLAASVGENVHSHLQTLTSYGASWALPLAAVVGAALAGAWSFLCSKLPEQGIIVPRALAGRVGAAVIAASVIVNLCFYARFASERSYSAARVPREIAAIVGAGAVLSEHGCSLAGYGNGLATDRWGFDFRTGNSRAKNPTHLFINGPRARQARGSVFQDGPHTKAVAVLTVKKVPAVLYALRNVPSGYEPSAYERGEALMREGSYGQALAEFRKGLKEHPDSGILRRSAGLALFRMRMFKDAEAEVREALGLLPEDFIADVLLAACLTVRGGYAQALEHLTWMKDYYELDLSLRKTVFDYRDALLAEGAGAGDGPRAFEPVLEMLSGYPAGVRIPRSELAGIRLPAVPSGLAAGLGIAPEARAAAQLRGRMSEALAERDFDAAAEAANAFSRLRGTTFSRRNTLDDLFPIGIPDLYPLDSAGITGGFVRDRLFYAQVAHSAASGSSRGQKILAVFDRLAGNIWPPETKRDLSGLSPREMALAGTGSAQETGWLFCLVLENLNIAAVLMDVELEGREEKLSLAAVKLGGLDGQWYMFAPGAGVPLVRGNSAAVATYRDLLEGKAGYPGGEPAGPRAVKRVTMLFAPEAQEFLPAAGDLEMLLGEKGLGVRCHRNLNEGQAYYSSILRSAGGADAGRTRSALWPYPFHLNAAISTRARIDAAAPAAGSRRIRELLLAGQYEAAFEMLKASPQDCRPVLAAAILLERRDYEEALRALGSGVVEPADTNRAAFLEGQARLALGYIPEAIESFRRINGPRAFLASCMTEKGLSGEGLHFTIGE